MSSLTKRSPKNWILLIVCTIFIISACQKQVDKSATQQQSEEVGAANNNGNGHLQQTKTFSSDVVVSWINLQLQMNKVPLPAGYCRPGQRSMYGILWDCTLRISGSRHAGLPNIVWPTHGFSCNAINRTGQSLSLGGEC
jgi:hypothetical protein